MYEDLATFKSCAFDPIHDWRDLVPQAIDPIIKDSLDIEELDSTLANLLLHTNTITQWSLLARQSWNKSAFSNRYDMCNTQCLKHHHVACMVQVAEVQEREDARWERTVESGMVEECADAFRSGRLLWRCGSCGCTSALGWVVVVVG
jgi:hypothetical protein